MHAGEEGEMTSTDLAMMIEETDMKGSDHPGIFTPLLLSGNYETD